MQIELKCEPSVDEYSNINVICATVKHAVSYAMSLRVWLEQQQTDNGQYMQSDMDSNLTVMNLI